jgi:hypothetical protein
MLSKLSL